MGPCDTPSTFTSRTELQSPDGAKVNVALSPHPRWTAPLGWMVPPEDALAVIVDGARSVNVAKIEWSE